MNHPELVQQVAELQGAVRFLAGHLVLLEREVVRLGGTVASIGVIAVTATPDADDPDTLAREAGAAELEHLATRQPADPAPSISSL